MRSTNYFCTVCYKTYCEWWDGTNLCNKQGIPTPKDDPLTTGKCDNTDRTNPLVKGKVCGGEIEID